MGKPKEFRNSSYALQKRKDRKIDKIKPSRFGCQENYLKSIEVTLQTELDSITASKKITRKVQKQLERYPLLAKAAFLGSERVVDSILESGENVNVQVPDESTPLILAVENGYPGIVQKLLKKGADPKLPRKDGRNSLMIAVAMNDNRSFTLIWNYWDKSSFCELNHADLRGYTALTIAVELGHSQLTNFLLSLNGIELDKQTLEGKTALMLAVLGRQTNVVQKLLNGGSDFVLEDKYGATAVCLAISHNSTEIKKLFYQFMDNKSRETYVKKRIELLSRSQGAENADVTAFYKGVLFRVILEIRKSFEDGVTLLAKYRAYASLYKCLENYQQDTELLRIGFHLAACLMHDDVEYNNCVAEELAEQYITTRFADFTLTTMENYRLKSMTEIRGAAFLCIQACTQCSSGRNWLRNNFSQLLPFVKEFKLIFSTMTFWTEGENTKAKVVFDQFMELFNCIEEDLKVIFTPSPAIPDRVSVSKNIDKTAQTLSGELISTEATTSSEWRMVTKKNAKNVPKRHSNLTMAPLKYKKDTKKKKKKPKLRINLLDKISVGKSAQPLNLKFTPNKERKSVSEQFEFSEKCYANALKKNLKSEMFFQNQEEYSRKDDYLLLKNESWPKVNGSSCLETQSEYKVDYNIQNTSALSAGNEQRVELDLSNSNSRKNNEQHSTGNFYDLWNNSNNSKPSTDLMTFIANLFQSNAKKDGIATQNALNKICAPAVTSPNPVIREHQKKQSKALCDILNAMGLKTGFEQVDTSETNKAISIPEISSKKEIKSEIKKEGENEARSKFLYSDCLKLTQDKEYEVKEYGETKNKASSENIVDEEKNEEIKKQMTNVEVRKFASNEKALVKECKKYLENDDESDQTLHSSTKSNETYHFDKEKSSSKIQNIKKVSEKSSSSIIEKSDLTDENINNRFTKSLKRKNPDACYRDISFSFYKEEIKDAKEKISPQFFKDLIDSTSSYRCLMVQNKTINSSTWNLNENKNTMIDRNPTDCNETERNSSYITNSSSNLSVHPKPIQSTPENALNAISRSDIIIPPKMYQQFLPNGCEIPVKTLTNKKNTGGKISYKSEKIIGLQIEGTFLNLDLSFQKSHKNLKYFDAMAYLSTEKFLVSLDVSLRYLQKIFMYKRMMPFQVMDQPRLSILFMKTHPLSSKTDLVLSHTKDCIKTAVENDYSNHQNDMMKFRRNSVGVSEEFKVISKFKSEIFKTISLLATDITKSFRKISRFQKERKMRNSTIKSATKSLKQDLSTPNGTNNTDTSFTFYHDMYGYKPKFINCEPRSQWYEKLHKIEECVPLAAFLLGFGQVGRSKVLHEIISPTGKIVFSSKEDHILRHGEFGTHIGIMDNGTPVVVRNFQKTELATIDIFSRKRHLKQENLVTFYYICSSPNDQRYFVITELVEFSLPEYLKRKSVLLEKNHLVQELVHAIQYLHENQIVHGFLKPSNVMVTIDDRLKVTGYYQLGLAPVTYGILIKQNKEKPAAIGSSAISDLSWRPFELISTTGDKADLFVFTKSADIQMTGMLIYYILSEGKHPFGSSDFKCQENILNGVVEFGPRPSDIESRDLIRDMIRRMPSQRPVIQDVSKHPYFWNIIRRFEFLVHVARKIEFFTRKPTKVAEALQNNCIEARDWTCCIHPQLSQYVSKEMNKVYANNYIDLLHFILSLNVSFDFMSKYLKDYIGHPAYFISRTFPTFFMSVYCVMRDNRFVQHQMAMQAYF